MYRTFASLLLLVFVACGKPEEEKLFTLLSSDQTGISFRNDLVSTAEMNILEYLYFYNGGGVATGDINNDGLVDIYFTSNQGENKLYLNKGNLEFEDITVEAGVTGNGGWSTGVTMADVNGDGWLDIYVCQVGDYKGLSGKNKLYINNGDLGFTEMAATYGLDFVGFSTHALFLDYDHDGDLDLYLLNHSIKKPEVFSHSDTKFDNQDEKGGDKLFKNLLSEGENRMVEVTQEAGILTSSLGFGLGVGAADINGDGWIDLYVSNDFTEDDYLYINQQDGTFRESLQDFISNTSRYSMGNDINDINNDGKPDIFTTDMLPEDPKIWMKSVGEDKQEVYDIKKRLGYKDQYVRNHLQLNLGNGRFSEIGLLTNTYASDWSWSPLIFDMDNDGKKDIHITNGIVKRPNDLDFIQYSQDLGSGLTTEEILQKQIKILPTVMVPNHAYHNQGDFVFTNASKDWGLDQASYSNGSTYADLDNDGDLDLIINNIDNEAFVYRNNSSETLANHFIQFDLQANGFNTFGLGAQVMVYRGEEILHQTLTTSRGFQSGVSTTLTFGLGDNPAVDSILVVWPGNVQEAFIGLAVDQKHKLQQRSGKSTKIPSDNPKAFFEIVDVGIDWIHQENTGFDDMRREYLIPRKFSTEGPALAVGDVNGDGLDDIYLGGATNQPGAIFLQQPNGQFSKTQNPFFEQLKMAEDVVAVFEDFNQDGHLDLFVGSGGNEHETGKYFNFDRVFLNDGRGNMIFSPNSLPPIGENTSTIAVHDVNGDGFLDLFVGASVVSGNYGANPKSTLLLSDGKGRFRDATEQYFGKDFHPGMVQKAIWADLDNKGQKNLILVGEWMPIKVYQKNQNGSYEIQENSLQNQSGWHYGLNVTDLDGDGKQEIIVGNLGLNSKLKASIENPTQLYHSDFDGNGQEDALIFHYMGGYLVPFSSRDDLIKQIPGIKRLHASYTEYAATKSPEELFETKQLEAATVRAANEFRSGIYWNEGDGNLPFAPFPMEGQFSPMQDIVSFKGKDEKNYLLGLGNFYGFRNDLGTSATQPLVLFVLEGKKIKTIPVGLNANDYWGEFRKAEKISINGKLHILAVRNNNSPIFLKPIP